MQFGAILLWTSWVGLVALPVLLNWSRYCYPAYDLGIYSQALKKIDWSLSLDALNPWISIRHINIFNDHFDPILIALAPLAEWIEPSLAAILVELSFIAVTGYILSRDSLWSSCVFLFSVGTTTALNYPAHPATWSVLPLLLLLKTFNSNSKNAHTTMKIWLAAFALLLFKEEYAPLILLLATTGFLLKSCDRRTALSLMSLALLWGTIAFWLRPLLLGPIADYSAGSILEWIKYPIESFRQKVLNPGIWRGLATLIIPILPVWAWMRKEQLKLEVTSLIILFGLMGIRFISGRWGHHYWIPITVCLILSIDSSSIKRAPIRPLALSLSLLLIVQIPFLNKTVRQTLLGGGLSHCPSDRDRLKDLAEIQKKLEFQHKSLPVLAPSEVLPRVVNTHEIFLFEKAPGIPTKEFLMITPQSKNRNTWPLSPESFDGLISQVRSERSVESIHNGSWFRLERVAPSEPHRAQRNPE